MLSIALLFVILAINLSITATGPIDEKRWKRNRIVPNVIDAPPSTTLEIHYDSSATTVQQGNRLTAAQTRRAPTRLRWRPIDAETYYTVVMIGAQNGANSTPSVTREVLHWLVVDIPGGDLSRGQTFMDYSGPESSSSHSDRARYVTLVYEQPNKFSFDPSYKKYLSSRDNFNAKQAAEWFDLGEPIAGNFFRQSSSSSSSASKASNRKVKSNKNKKMNKNTEIVDKHEQNNEKMPSELHEPNLFSPLESPILSNFFNMNLRRTPTQSVLMNGLRQMQSTMNSGFDRVSEQLPDLLHIPSTLLKRIPKRLAQFSKSSTESR